MRNSRPINVSVGPMNFDVPRTAGYYGGVGLALAFGLIEWPVAVFIGAIPAVQMLRRRDLGRSVNFVVQLLEGAAQPVGGDADGTVELTSTPRGLRRAARGDPAGAVAEPVRATRRRGPGGATGARASRRAADGTTAGTTRRRRTAAAGEATPANGRRRRTAVAGEAADGRRRRATRRSPTARTPGAQAGGPGSEGRGGASS